MGAYGNQYETDGDFWIYRIYTFGFRVSIFSNGN